MDCGAASPFAAKVIRVNVEYDIPPIGRDAEMAALLVATSEVIGKVGSAFLIDGAAGIGKTALLTDWLARPSLTECQVIFGVCDELSQHFPLSAVVQALWPGGGDVAPRHSIIAAEQLTAEIARRCADRPVILVLEDLHWADDASLLLWRRLCQAAAGMPLLLVGTRRPPVCAQADELRREVADCGGHPMTVRPLEPGQVSRLATGLAGGGPGPRLIEYLRSAAGNPLYVRALIDEARRSGALDVAADAAELARATEGAAASTIARVVARRTDAWPARATGVLRWAALIGTEFSISELTAVAGKDAAPVLTIAERAMADGLVVACLAESGLAESGLVVGDLAELGDTAEWRLRFRHDLIRERLIESVPAPLRIPLHLHAARALADAGAPAERVARQLLGASQGLGGWGLDWLLSQSEPLAASAPAIAAELFEHALQQLDSMDSRRAGLAEQLAGLCLKLSRYERAEQIARELLARGADAERVARSGWLLGTILLRQRRYGELVRADPVRNRIDIPPIWRARLAAQRGLALTLAGHVQAGRPFIVRALTDGERLADPAAIAWAWHGLATSRMLRLDFAAALRFTRRALTIAKDDETLADLRVILLGARSGIELEMGQPWQAARAASMAMAQAGRTGSAWAGLARGQAAGLAYEQGRWDAALAAFNSVMPDAAGEQDRLAVLALVHGHRDEWEAAETHLAALGGLPDADLGAAALAARVLQHERSAQASAAVALLSRRFASASPLLQHGYRLLPALARLAQDNGDTAAALAAVELSARQAARASGPLLAAVSHWCRGYVHGDPGALLAAADVFQAAGLPLCRGNALEDAAMVQARTGDDTARVTAAIARQVYESLDAGWDARRLVSRLRAHGVRVGGHGSHHRNRGGPEALTEAEREVARLAAQGYANPEIAAYLQMSRRTVESHMSRILAKLQLNSRRELDSEQAFAC
jgi:DNA-binding CsgD family transcriptional regulator